MFDKKDCGKISEEELKKILTNKRGEPLDEDEIKAMYKGNPPIADGEVDYKAFAHLITTGAQDELASA
jgi:myosin regulatory light chain 12